jgi:hypothetical protein
MAGACHYMQPPSIHLFLWSLQESQATLDAVCASVELATFHLGNIERRFIFIVFFDPVFFVPPHNDPLERLMIID